MMGSMERSRAYRSQGWRGKATWRFVFIGKKLPRNDDVTHDRGDHKHGREPDEWHVRDERIERARIAAEGVNRRGGYERETEDYREQRDTHRVPCDDEGPRRSLDSDQNREPDGDCPGRDIEVPSGKRHLCRHQPFTRGLVHDQLERQAKALRTDERRERKPACQAVAHARES